MKNKIALFATVPVVAAISIGAFATIQAQEDSNIDIRPNREEKMIEFSQKVADNLQVEFEELIQARKDAATSLIDEKVAAGELDVDKAEQMKLKIEESETGLPEIGHNKRAKMHKWFSDDFGMTPEELKAELDSGKTIEEIAEEKDVELPEKSGRFERFQTRINQ